MVTEAGRSEVLLDTSVLVDFSRGLDPAVTFIDAGPPSRFVLHPVSEAELLGGALDRHELRALVDLVGRFGQVRCQPEDFDHGIAFVKRFALAHGIGWPDCLIAATALRLKMPIATLNDKHFRSFRGLKVIRPY